MPFLRLWVCSALLFIHFSVQTTFFRHCASRCANKVLAGIERNYNVCMKRYLSESEHEWLLKNETTNGCELLFVDSAASPVCSARDIYVVSSSTNISHHSTSLPAVREFISVIWTPCPYGISDVEGYEINLMEVNIMGFTYCKQVFLTRKLEPDASNREFSVFFESQELDYAMDYKISIEGLPKTSHRHHAYVDFQAMSCTDLNGVGSCHCGLKGLKPAPPVNVTVSGYTVIASLPMLDLCFRVHTYKLSLLHIANSTTVLETLDLSPESNSSVVWHTFFPLYSSSPSYSKLALQYQAFAGSGDSTVGIPTLFSVMDWVPQTPSISFEKGAIRVNWGCAPNHYTISNYEIQLNWHGLHPGKGVGHQSIYRVPANCTKNKEMVMTLLSVRPGIYTVQVREWRAKSTFFQDVRWSKSSTPTNVINGMHKDYINKHDLITAAAVLFPLVVVIVLALLAFYFTKKGYCKKIHNNVPLPLGHVLGSHAGFQHSPKTVWLVWQADDSDELVSEIHSQNIRHLAAYLAKHCGLNVILDQYEVSSTPSFTAWLQEKQKCVDVVLFVCPHTAQPQFDRLPVCLFGNFSAVFRLYESALLNGDLPAKLAMAILPYSRTDSCTASKLLLNTVPSFKLMDEIESLYFYIQNRAKVHHFGRRVVKYVHRHEYAETVEGSELKRGIEKMIMIRRNQISLPSSQRLSISEEAHNPQSPYSKDVKMIKLEITRPQSPAENLFLNNSTSQTKPDPPPPVSSEEDADESMFLINTRELLSLQPIESEPVSPVLIDSCCPLLLRPDNHHQYEQNIIWCEQNGQDMIYAAQPAKQVIFHDRVAIYQ